MHWLTSLPEEHLNGLLRGIWVGDGIESDRGFTFGTASIDLWNFVQLALLRLGVRFAVDYGEEHPGRRGTVRRSLVYYIRSSDTDKINEIVHPTLRHARSGKMYRTSTWYQDGFFAFPVGRVTRTLHSGEVWNLEVEGANSYALQGGTVHNCLPKDTYYLTYPASQRGFKSRLLQLARQVNDGMPEHVVRMLRDAYSKLGSPVRGSKIAILGLAFKGNTSDTRQSPSIDVIRGLQSTGASISAHDPLADLKASHLPQDGVVLSHDLKRVLKSAEAVLILTDHIEYRALTARHLKSLSSALRLIIDTRHILDPAEVVAAGIVYRAIGVGVNVHLEGRQKSKTDRR